jgi:hypothetical protein
MRGFRAFASAARFCTAFDEVYQYFRLRPSSPNGLPLPELRCQFQQRFDIMFAACSAWVTANSRTSFVTVSLSLNSRLFIPLIY